jgi:hypothetical protein
MNCAGVKNNGCNSFKLPPKQASSGGSGSGSSGSGNSGSSSGSGVPATTDAQSGQGYRGKVSHFKKRPNSQCFPNYWIGDPSPSHGCSGETHPPPPPGTFTDFFHCAVNSFSWNILSLHANHNTALCQAGNVFGTVAFGGAAKIATRGLGKVGGKVLGPVVGRVMSKLAGGGDSADAGSTAATSPPRKPPTLSQRVRGALSDETGATGPFSMKGRLRVAQLPSRGRIRYVPPEGYSPRMPLPRARLNGRSGFVDRFGNVWAKGGSRTAGEPFEWDVQLSRTGRAQIGWLSREGSHVNVSLNGRVTHR